MKIATIDLGEKPLFLAPMEDVTDPSFRFMCKRYGADMVYTEFIPSDGLIRDASKALAKLNIFDYERPVGIQLYGHEIEPMVEAARMAEAAGPDLIDINFGCPVKKIAGRGAGSGMMRDVPLMVEMTRRIVGAVKLPVTVKTRLGWDDDSKNIVEIAERLQDVGIAALTIHGRTRAQMYRGEADWTLIGEVKRTCPVCASRRKSVSLSAASASVCCRESDHFARSYVFAGNRTASSPTSSASGTASSRASRLPSLSCRARSSWLSSSSARTPTTSRIAQAAGGVCKMTRHKTSTGSTPASR